MERFCIITNRLKDEALAVTDWIKKYLGAKGKQVIITKASGNSGQDIRFTDAESIPEDVQCAIVLGGDGTLLQAAYDLRNKEIPILGINLGTLGFLAETERGRMEEAFDELFKGNYTVEPRMMLTVAVNPENNDFETGTHEDALNDIVITRSGFSRLITVAVYVNGAFVDEYRGDGVIVATPTGSTGYNLSAGGPVVIPKAKLMVITPICPHSLNTRSIVVSSDDRITMKICESKKTQEEEAMVTVDGNISMRLKANDCIMIKKATHKTRLVRLNNCNFFDILRAKFG